MCTKVWLGSLKEGSHSEYIGTAGKILLKLVSRSSVGMCELD
jgi:hypothetical protein